MTTFSNIEISGMHFNQPGLIALGNGETDVELTREPLNKYDPNAIRVDIVRPGLLWKKRIKLGYIEAEMNKQFKTGELTAKVTEVWFGDVVAIARLQVTIN